MRATGRFCDRTSRAAKRESASSPALLNSVPTASRCASRSLERFAPAMKLLRCGTEDLLGERPIRTGHFARLLILEDRLVAGLRLWHAGRARDGRREQRHL